MDRNMDLCGDL